MLIWAFLAFSVAVPLGLALLAGRLRQAALVHGAAGLAGLVLLAAALWRGAPRGPFAWDALVLAGAAAAGGVIIFGLARSGRRLPALLFVLHATAGGLAYLLLAGFVFGRQTCGVFQNFTLDSAGHLIQVALTPVFLLSGIAALLNVFAGRLARVADRLDAMSATIGDKISSAEQHDEIARLHRRSVVLDIAVVLGTLGAAATCMAILTLFLFALSNKAIAGVLLSFFGLAIVCTLVSVSAFGLEMLMSSKALRERMRFHAPRLVFWRRKPD